MNAPLQLPRREQDLYDLLAGKGDVAIIALYIAMGGPEFADPTYPQKWLGPYITRLNRRVKNLRMKVKPGVARETYQLVIL